MIVHSRFRELHSYLTASSRETLQKIAFSGVQVKPIAPKLHTVIQTNQRNGYVLLILSRKGDTPAFWH